MNHRVPPTTRGREHAHRLRQEAAGAGGEVARCIKRSRDGAKGNNGQILPLALGWLPRSPLLASTHAMDLISGNSRGLLVAAASLLLLLLGQVCPQEVLKDGRETCLLPPLKGSCRALISSWYYDKYTQTCKEFTYGGCEGNGNNFESQAACWKACRLIPKVPKVCRLEPDVGPCRALFPRYFFNISSMTCETFEYGGCHGNENQFEDRKSCMDYCLPVKTAPLLCYRAKDEGLCSASVPRFFYNIKTKRCEELNYTGCGGNENNFVTQKDCWKVCRKAGRKPSFERVTIRKPRKPQTNA
ncbi:tissue factor pathway inhibitor 2 [Hemicordylus capensis]|uniref:tissue factor pathway inhibitor 2 n=1 Tax=Hemicordylus capensis TaxID=884348 RepID=UPI002302AFBC|nr:tissue factor pathway inhibitor 2 [Hemicordylus capensis]